MTYSVVIPVYNAEQTVLRALDSVEMQSHPPTEIIIIDDASTDASYALLESRASSNPKIKLFQNEENKGVAYSRNRGFRHVSSDFTALLDADDWWEINKMELQLSSYLENHWDFSYTSYFLKFPDGKEKVYSVPKEITLQQLLKENVIGCSSVVLKNSLTQNYSMSSEFFHEDFVYWLHLLQMGYKGFGLSQPMMHYHISESNRSGNKWNAAKNRWNIYRDLLNLSLLQSLKYMLFYTLFGIKKYLSFWLKPSQK